MLQGDMVERTDGIAGLPFIEDIITLLKDKWIPDNCPLPEFVKYWEVKETGLGDSKYSKVIVSLDSENPQIFSLLQINEGVFSWDWLHEITVTIDVRSGESERRVLEMVSEVVRILKNNVVPVINGRDYVNLLPGPTTSMNEDYRNLYRYLVDCTALRYNP